MRLLQKFWAPVKLAIHAAKPCRFALVMTLLIPIIFIKVEQASEVLRMLAEGPAQTDGAKLLQSVFLLVALVTVCLYAWYFSRVLLNFKFPDSPSRDHAAVRCVVRYLPRMVGIIPAAGFALAFFLASRVYAGSITEVARVLLLYSGVCAGIAIALHAFFIARRWYIEKKHGRSDNGDTQVEWLNKLPRETKVAVWGLAGVSALLFGLFVFFPVSVAQMIGAGTVMLLAAACWICYGSMAVYVAHRWQVPVITPIVVLVCLFSLWNDNHQVRTLPGTKAPKCAVLQEHYAAWFSNLHARFPNEERHPVFVISAEGGGVRAAFWTATVLARLQDADTNFAAHVLAISGVSGGALGATVFDALVAERNVTNYTDAAQRVLSHDFLSPALAHMLFPDVCQRYLPIAVPAFDRAVALEKAWEHGWRAEMKTDRFAKDFASLWAGDLKYNVPALFLNGTSVETGQRMIASNVLIDGTFHDARDVNERLDRDMRLSTAAHMSARFTYLSPAGRFTNGEHIVDGGYFENSGTTTAADILDVVKAEQFGGRVIPISIVIKNAPEESGGNKKQNRFHEFASEALAPLQALLHTRNARGSYSEVALNFRQGTNVINFELSPCETPLPLGWSLSQGAIDEMNRQVETNLSKIVRVTDLLPRKADTVRTTSAR